MEALFPEHPRYLFCSHIVVFKHKVFLKRSSVEINLSPTLSSFSFSPIPKQFFFCKREGAHMNKVGQNKNT